MSERINKIKSDIAKIEASMKVYSKKSDATSKKIVQSFKVKLDSFEKELNKAEKEEKSALKKIQIKNASKKVADLKKLISSKKYAIYKGAGVDLEKDAKVSALPYGKRKAKTTGNTYYEYRANRVDIKPKKYPKLEHGGYMDKGGDTEIFEKFIKSQIEYAISLSSVSEKKKVIKLLLENMSDYVGDDIQKRITTDNLKYALSQNTSSKINEVLKTSLNALDRGYMAKGGEVENLEKELRKLQRELNSSRLRTYMEGDTSEAEMARQKEWAEKMARFNEVLELLRKKDAKYAKGGGIDGQKIAKPSGWRWKNEAIADGIINDNQLYKTPSERARKEFPDYVYFEDRLTKSDKNPSKKFISLETGGKIKGYNLEIELFFKGLSGDNRKIGKYVVTEKTLENLEEEWIDVLSIDVIDETNDSTIYYYDLKKEIFSKGKKAGFFETGGEMQHSESEIDEKVEKYIDRLKNGEKVKRYFHVRGKSNPKYFETILPNTSEKGMYKRYESVSNSSIGKLQNEYLSEDDLREYFKKTIVEISKHKGTYEEGGEMVRNPSMESFSVGDKVKYKGKRSKYMATVLKVFYDENLPYAEIKFDNKDKVEEAYLDDLVKLKLMVADEYVNPNYMAKGGGFSQYGEPYGFEEDDSDSVYEIHHKPEMNEKNPFLIWDKIDGVYVAEFPNRQRALHYIDNKGYFEHGGYMAKGGGIGEIDMNEVESSAMFYTDDTKWTPKPTIKKFVDEIEKDEKLKKMLDNKEITPSKIIGTGYKSQYARPLAYKYLNERILIAKRAIEILKERGHSYANGGELHRTQQ